MLHSDQSFALISTVAHLQAETAGLRQALKLRAARTKAAISVAGPSVPAASPSVSDSVLSVFGGQRLGEGAKRLAELENPHPSTPRPSRLQPRDHLSQEEFASPAHEVVYTHRAVQQQLDWLQKLQLV